MVSSASASHAAPLLTPCSLADWYDNEHVPLRTQHFPTFRSAARYSVTSNLVVSPEVDSVPSLQTGWAAVYTISSLALFNDPAYAALRTKRSKREAELLGRIASLDRRIYRLVYDSAAAGAKDVSRTEDIAPANVEPAPAGEAAPCIVCTSVTPAEGNKAAFDEWYEKEHAPLLAQVQGWRRTRRYELVDALIVGSAAAKDNADARQVPKCLGLNGELRILRLIRNRLLIDALKHTEWDSPAFEQTDKFKQLMKTPWRERIVNENGGTPCRERKVLSLYRAWDPVAASKEQS